MRSIYVISPGHEGPSKIGIAASLRGRLESIQTGYWGKLHLCYFNSFYKPNLYGGALGIGEGFASCETAAQKLESGVHKRLRDMGFHIRGEWFDLPPKDAAAVIEKTAKIGGLKPLVDERFWQYVSLYGADHPGSKASKDGVRKFLASLEFGADAVAKFNKLASQEAA